MDRDKSGGIVVGGRGGWVEDTEPIRYGNVEGGAEATRRRDEATL